MDELEELEEENEVLTAELRRIELRKNDAIRALFNILAEVQAPDDTSDIEEYKRMQSFIIDIICEFLQEDN
jgi:hypothetical protein